jgi:acyl-CoA dehydrogenase family protein 9
MGVALRGMAEGSFARGLFFGAIEEDLIFPWREGPAAETNKLQVLIDDVRRFFQEHVDSAAIDRAEQIPDRVFAGLKQRGAFGLCAPQALGGLGFSATASARAVQEIAGLDLGIGITLAAHHSLALRALLLFGTDGQKARYVPRLARGEIIAAFALAEPGAGSDAAGIQTMARTLTHIPGAAPGTAPRLAYALDGAKAWITNGAFADLFTVFARTSPPDEGAKPKITGFLVERGPGVTSGPNQSKLGVRGASTTVVRFDGVQVPGENVLGEVGRGFRVAMQSLDYGRLDLASASVGVCKHAIKLTLDRCRQRRAFGRPIGEFGLVKDKVATMMAETWASESATYLTAGLVDGGTADFSVEGAICKVLASETCWRVVNDAMQVAAGAGYMAGEAYERLLRDARVTLVLGGTSEILRAFIALSGMQGPARQKADVARALQEPIKGFGLLGEIALRKARGALGRDGMTHHHPLLQREAGVLERFVQELSRGVDNVLRKHGRDIAEMQYTQKRTADMAIELYAVAACIVRATRAIERRGPEGARREVDLTRIFVASSEQRLAQTVAEIDKNDDELRKSVATRAYVDGAYPFDIT